MGELLGAHRDVQRVRGALPCSAVPFPSTELSPCSAACQDGFEQTLSRGGKPLNECWRKGRRFKGRNSQVITQMEAELRSKHSDMCVCCL